MCRLRTIKDTAKYYKTQDPDTCITEYFLRQLVKTGKLKHVKAGCKYLVDLDYLEHFLSNPPETDGNIADHGKIRRLKP